MDGATGWLTIAAVSMAYERHSACLDDQPEAPKEVWIFFFILLFRFGGSDKI